MIWAGLALAGAAGAVARWLLDQGISALAGRLLPWGVLGVNVLGCLLLGIVTGLGQDMQLLSTGFLGAFTTFSTVCVDVVRMLGESHRLRAAGYAALTLVLGVLALCLGVLCSGALTMR